MNVFITGATGFIGSILIKDLINKGHIVHALCRPSSFHKIDLSHSRIKPFEGDLLDVSSLVRAMKGCEQAYHVAAYARVWARDESTFYKVNVTGTRNVLKAALNEGISRVVVTSSAATLPASRDGTAVDESAEKNIFETEYARSKYMAEQETQLFNQKGLEAIIVNPPRVYGPGLLSESNAVTKLIKWYIEGKWHFLPGDGRYVGNYAYVEDVARGHRQAMNHGTAGERYILGGENLSLKELFNLIGKVTGTRRYLLPVPLPAIQTFAKTEYWKASLFKSDPLITPSWLDNYLKNSPLSSQKAKNNLGYSVTPVRDGIKNTVEWLRNRR